METRMRPPSPPYRTSERIDTCTKTQGSSLRGPEDHGVSEGVNRKDPQKLRPARGKLRPGESRERAASWGAFH